VIRLLFDHRHLFGCPVFELSGPSAAIPDEWFGDDIRDLRRRTGPENSLVSPWISVYTSYDGQSFNNSIHQIGLIT